MDKNQAARSRAISSGDGSAVLCPHLLLVGMWIGDVRGYLCESCDEFFVEVECETCNYSLESYSSYIEETPRAE